MAECIQNNKTAAITDVWIIKNQNLVKKYRRTKNLTANEQLYP